jgi:tRNA-dihydrouridine synthase B
MNLLESTSDQLAAVDAFFDSQQQHGDRLQYRPATAQDVVLAA